jgi:hypothetical protein
MPRAFKHIYSIFRVAAFLAKEKLQWLPEWHSYFESPYYVTRGPCIAKLQLYNCPEMAAATVRDYLAVPGKFTVVRMNISPFAGTGLPTTGVFLQPLGNQYVDHAEVTPHTWRGCSPSQVRNTSMNLPAVGYEKSVQCPRTEPRVFLCVGVRVPTGTGMEAVVKIIFATVRNRTHAVHCNRFIYFYNWTICAVCWQ